MMYHLLCLSLIGMVLAGCVSPSVYGLRPEYPVPRLAPDPFFTFQHPHPRAAFVDADSRQPTLRWQPFPDDDDRKEDREGLLNQVHHVTYDLKLLRAERDHPSQLIYTRSELPEPSHRVETVLERSTHYFWTVRARFELNGVTRVTPWGRIRSGSSWDIVVPSPFYFGLKTPAE